MKVENQVCSIQQAKQLKQLGVFQRKDGFWWADTSTAVGETWDDMVDKSNRYNQKVQLKIGEPTTREEYIAINAESFLYIRNSRWDMGITSYVHGKCLAGEHYAAFTVSELGMMLPKKIGEFFLTQKFATYNEESYRLYYRDYSSGFTLDTGKITNSCEAAARADMLIHLLENKLFDVDKINNQHYSNQIN